MKNRIIVLIIMSLTLSVCQAQVEISREAFNKAKDYLNCKMTYALIDEHARKKPADDKRDNAIRELNNVTPETAKNFGQLSGIIQKNFSGILRKLSTRINNINYEPSPAASYNQAANRLVDSVYAAIGAAYEGYDLFSSSKENWQNEVMLFFQTSASNVSKVKNTVVTPPNGSHEGGTTDDNFNEQEAAFLSPSGFNLWTLILLLLIAGLGFLIYRIKDELADIHSHNGRRKAEIAELKRESGTSEVVNRKLNGKDPQASTTVLEVALKDLRVELDELKQYIKDRESVKEKRAPVSVAGQVSLLKEEQAYKEPVKNTDAKNNEGELFYMVGPVNNYFPLSGKSATKENTLYKFRVQPNKQEALYELHTTGASVNDILNMVESYVRPACDEDNIPGSNVRSIVTRTKGLAVLEDDKWTIKTKAIIRYE
jgi:hypothetical protein